MRNIKYKDFELTYKPDTKKKIIREYKDRATEFLVTCKVVLLYFLVFFAIPLAITLIDRAFCNHSKSFVHSFFVFCCAFILSWTLAAIALGILCGIANIISRKRFVYLPLTKEECQKFNINSSESYCNFLNNFLCVTIFSKDGVRNRACLPECLLFEINEMLAENFSDDKQHIRFDKEKRIYFCETVTPKSSEE